MRGGHFALVLAEVRAFHPHFGEMVSKGALVDVLVRVDEKQYLLVLLSPFRYAAEQLLVEEFARLWFGHPY